MLKTILAFSASALLLTPGLQAQGRRGGGFAAVGHGTYAHGDYHHGGGRGGRYYYFGGVPYFFPFDFGLGFGYPAYAYDFGYGYGYGYPGVYGDPAYGPAPYEGKNSGQPGAPGSQSLPAVVQQQLAKQGYYKGAIDGKFGPASRAALSRFQSKNGLQETGRIDEPTLMALGFSDHR